MNSTAPLPEWLEIASAAAQAAGALLQQFWGNLKDIRDKAIPGDLVTEADQASERLLIAWLSRHFPAHQILAEESGWRQSPSPFIWAVDPLDGTTNFAHQYPVAAVSMGLIYQEEVLLGVIYNPFTQELFQAVKGGGAYLNGHPIRVSQVTDLAHSLLSTGFPYDRRHNPDNNYAEFCRFTDLTQGVRRAGAASLDLAYVACGRLDGYWEKGLKPWDMAAGVVLVQEAGGQATDYLLEPLKWAEGRILASNGHLHATMSQVLSEYRLGKVKNHHG